MSADTTGRHEDLVIAPDEGAPFAFAGLTAYLKLAGDLTGERFALAYFPDLPPRRLAAPLHRHHREDEYTFVLDGTLGVLQDDQVITAAAGTSVIKPRGLWHTFFNPGDRPCRLLEIVSPAGFARYFEEVAALGGRMEGLPAINARYAIDMDLAGIPALCARLGLEFPRV